MEYIYIGIFIIIIVFFIQVVLLPYLQKKRIDHVLEEISIVNNYQLKLIKGKPYSHILITPEYNLYFTSINIPANSQVFINSFRTWRLFWGGSSTKPGRSFPKDRYINEITPFLNFKTTNVNDRKVVILYKKTEKVLMYINESELEQITSQDLPHGIKVIEYEKLFSEFENLLK